MKVKKKKEKQVTGADTKKALIQEPSNFCTGFDFLL